MKRLLLFIFTTVCTLAWAQPSTTVGVILSGSGTASEIGTLQLAAAQSVQSTWTVLIRNDESRPEHAVSLANQLMSDGASALICCTTEEATEAVAQLAAEQGVLLFALRRTEPGPWIIQLEPSLADQLTGLVNQLVLAEKQNASMLAVDTPELQELGFLFQQLGGLGSINVTEPVFVTENEQELRPEMLWLASRELSALMFVGPKTLLTRALAAGEQRGFTGDIYVPADTLGQQFDQSVYIMLPPFTSEPTSLYGYQVAMYNTLFQDVIAWLEYGADSAFGVPIPIDTPAQWRQLLRDSVVSLPPFERGRIAYDAHDDGRSAITPQSLRAFQVNGTRLQEGAPGLR